MHIGSTIDGGDALFENQNASANFSGMTVGDIGSFPRVIFNGPVDSSASNFRRLDFRGLPGGFA